MFTKWIRRRAVTRIVLALLVGLIALISMISSSPWVFPATFGVKPLHGKEVVDHLRGLEDPNDYVDIEGTATFDTGLEWVTVDQSDGSRTKDYSVVALVVDESLILVKVDGPTDAVHFRGRVNSLPADLYDSITEDADPAVTDRILPLTIDATSDWKLWGTLLFGGLVALMVLAACAIAVYVRLIIQPRRARVLRHAGDPTALLATIDEDLARPDALVGKRFAVGETYFATRKLGLVPLTDIVWTYQKITSNKAYGIVTVNRVRELIVQSAAGSTTTIVVKDSDTSALDAFGTRIPWAFFGHTPEREQAWRDTAVRTQMIQASAQRRDEVLQTAPAQMSPLPHSGTSLAPGGAATEWPGAS